jgi:hypothetical protein
VLESLSFPADSCPILPAPEPPILQKLVDLTELANFPDSMDQQLVFDYSRAI